MFQKPREISVGLSVKVLRPCEPDRRQRPLGLRDGRGLLEIAERHDVALIIHGHIHERFVHPRGPVTPVPIANAGSLTDRKHDRAYHIYELKDDALEVSVRRYDEAKDCFVDWPDAPGAGVVK